MGNAVVDDVKIESADPDLMAHTGCRIDRSKGPLPVQSSDPGLSVRPANKLPIITVLAPVAMALVMPVLKICCIGQNSSISL